MKRRVYEILLLVLHNKRIRENSSAMIYSFSAEKKSLGEIMRTAEQFAADSGCSQGQIMNFLLAAEELAVNIISYAYTDENGMMWITFEKRNGEILMRFSDSGKPFNLLEAEDPDVSLSLEERTPGGLGIYLVKKLALSLEYSRKDNKNIVTAVFPCG